MGRRFWSVKMPPQVCIANGVLGTGGDVTAVGIDVVSGGTVVVLVELLRGPLTQPLKPMITTVASPIGHHRQERTFPVLAECHGRGEG